MRCSVSVSCPVLQVGIRQGDEIVEVDGVSLRQQTPFQVTTEGPVGVTGAMGARLCVAVCVLCVAVVAWKSSG